MTGFLKVVFNSDYASVSSGFIGNWWVTGNVECTDCTAGKFSAVAGASVADTCANCDLGTYWRLELMSAPAAAPARTLIRLELLSALNLAAPPVSTRSTLLGAPSAPTASSGNRACLQNRLAPTAAPARTLGMQLRSSLCAPLASTLTRLFSAARAGRRRGARVVGPSIKRQ
jgi:hypothetical protein